MTTLRLPLLATLAASLFVASGCDSKGEEITATASGSADDSGSGSGNNSSSGETGDAPTSSTTSAETDGASATSTGNAETTEGSDTELLADCQDAQSEQACQATPTSTCQWFPTTTFLYDFEEETCEDLGIEGTGRCIAISDENFNCPGALAQNCADGAGIYYAETDSGEGFEILRLEPGTACSGPSDMLACQLNSEPSPGSEVTFFPSQCECVCDEPG